MTAEAGRGNDFVRSLERGLAVIRAFGPDRPALTLSEVARITGLTRAAARRFLLTLTELGYVHSDGRMFSLRPRVLELGYAYLSTLGLNEVAAPHMEQLVADLKESSSVAVLDGDDVAYVVRVPTRTGSPHMRAMLTSKPMVYAPCLSRDAETRSPSPVRSRAYRAALIIPAAVMPTEWSPMPPRWNGSAPPGGVREAASPLRAQNAAMSYAGRSASGPVSP